MFNRGNTIIDREILQLHVLLDYTAQAAVVAQVDEGIVESWISRRSDATIE